MSKILVGAAALALLAASPALAQTPYPRAPYPGRDIATGSLADAPGGMMYPRDGNTKMPRQPESPAEPFYQRGSGQETGGPARELIPRHLQ